MYCSECGQKLPDSAKFCPQCGTASEANGIPVQPTTSVQTTDSLRPVASVSSPIRPIATSQLTPPLPRPVITQGGGWLSRNRNFVMIIIAGIILLFVIGRYFSGPSGPESDTTVQQWMTVAGSFYQGYFQNENQFEIVNQNPRTTHQEAVNAWTRLVQGLQSMRSQLDRMQPPPKTAREDAADMIQIRQLWSDLLATEIQMGQQLLQYSQQGQKPPSGFLQGTLPRLWQTKNKLLQDQQQILVRLAARHRISAFNPGTSGRR